MVKLRFDNLVMSQFNSFKLVLKKKAIKTDSNKKLTPRLVKGICIKDGDDYKIEINIKALKPDIIDKGQPDLLILPFTEDSYDLKGVVSVFDREPDKKGKYTRYVRNEINCKFFPGSPERYTPFCHNWICSGYIVRHNGKLMFDFNDCISPKGYGIFINEDDD